MFSCWCGDSMDVLCSEPDPSCPNGLLFFFTDGAAAGLKLLLVSPRGFWESAPSMSESTPTQRLVSGGQTCRLMGPVKHSDILQTPVSERCHTLAVIVMGSSGRLNQQAGDLYYAAQHVKWTHTHTHTCSKTPSVSAVRGAAAHTPRKMAGRSLSVLMHHFFFYMSDISSLFHHLVPQSSCRSESLPLLLSTFGLIAMNITWFSYNKASKKSPVCWEI